MSTKTGFLLGKIVFHRFNPLRLWATCAYEGHQEVSNSLAGGSFVEISHPKSSPRSAVRDTNIDR